MKRFLAGIFGVWAFATCSQVAGAPKCDQIDMKAQEEALTAAWRRALASIDAARRPAFEASQRQWMENYQGVTAPFLSDKACTEAKLLGAETLDQRRAWIEGRAETGLREPIVQPFSVWRDAKPGEWRLSLDLTRFEKPSLPGDHLFNSVIARIEKDALNNYPAGPADADASRPYEYSTTVRVT